MDNCIRIFLSSTFKDMHKERDYLVKKVFPALRDVAEGRGIPFSWCDLRFGVSSFEEDNIVRLCLRNIESCSPYFMGLLGRSYGSIPQNLNKEQIKRLSVFQGVPSMIKKKYGYTEIEMRYFISQKDESDYCDLYFFVGEFNLNNHSFGDWKYFLIHPLSIITLLLKALNKDKLSSLKKFVLAKSSQVTPIYWVFDENEPVTENIIYQSIIKLLECKYPLSSFPNEELIWNEQQAYMQSQIHKTFCIGNIDNDIQYNNSKDILNLYSSIATGKTVYIANLLKKSSEKGCACFYYFIGASRGINTPLNIWKSILYQVCKYSNIDYGLYKHVNSMGELRKITTLLIHQISKNVLIAIDGFGDDVNCSIQHKNTFISDFPDPQNNIKYIISSSYKLPEVSRVLSIEHKITNNTIEQFLKNYLKYYYGGSLQNLLISLMPYPKDLREARYCIDEFFINTSLKFNGGIDSRNNVYESIKNRIISNIERQSNFYEGDKQIFLDSIINAIQVLSLSKYGIFESDICNICNVNAEQWTLIYSYLFAFFKSKGFIKLQESIAKQFSSAESCEVTRVQFIKNLNNNNKSSKYTAEILYQASQLKNKYTLCEILSDIDTFVALYELDKDLLTEYLIVVDKACLIKDFMGMLDASLFYKEIDINPLSKLFKIVTFFHKDLSRYAIALHYIDIANKYIEDHSIPIEYQLEFNTKKADVLINIGKFDEALELLQLVDGIIKDNRKNDEELFEQHVVSNLLLKAQLYDNDLQESSEKINALDIYRELIDKHQDNLETDNILYVLDRYIMLKKKGDDVERYVGTFASILSDRNIIKEQSHLYNKYAIKQVIHALCINRFDAESKTTDDLFVTLFRKLDESLQIYPYSHDTYDNLFFIFELLTARQNRLCNKDLYDKYKENIIILQPWIAKYATLSKLIYSRESIDYANAMFHSAKLYSELSYVQPQYKVEYLEKSIEYSIEAEELYGRIYPEHSILTAKLYHNKAKVFSMSADFKNAMSCINKAIGIKDKLLRPMANSLFKSKLRRISILVNQVVYAEDLNCILEEVELCHQYLGKLKFENLNNTELLEPKQTERINSIEELENKLFMYIKDPKERYFEVGKIKFEECKRIKEECKRIKELKNTNNYKGAWAICLAFYNKAKDLELYLENHELNQLFYKRCNDYRDFRRFFVNICKYNNMLDRDNTYILPFKGMR